MPVLPRLTLGQGLIHEPVVRCLVDLGANVRVGIVGAGRLQEGLLAGRLPRAGSAACQARRGIGEGRSGGRGARQRRLCEGWAGQGRNRGSRADHRLAGLRLIELGLVLLARSRGRLSPARRLQGGSFRGPGRARLARPTGSSLTRCGRTRGWLARGRLAFRELPALGGRGGLIGRSTRWRVGCRGLERRGEIAWRHAQGESDQALAAIRLAAGRSDGLRRPTAGESEAGTA
jgi:hypothetical protein